MSNSKNIYSTSDLALAAYLKLKGLKLVGAKKNNKRFDFTFEDPDDRAGEIALEFVNSDMRRYDDEIRSLKKIIYTENN
jgi:hypothetical protein